MDIVITRRRASFYFSIIFVCLFLGGLAATLIAIGLEDHSWSLFLLAAFMLLMLYYFVSRYYRNASIVSVGQGGIAYRGKHYHWTDVSSIQLTGSQPINMIGAKPTEGTKIIFMDGAEIILSDSMYSNLGAVRLAIVQAMPELAGITREPSHVTAARNRQQQNAAAIPDLLDAIDSGGIRYVKGNAIFNINGIFAWVFALGSIIVAACAPESWQVFLCLSMGFGFGLLFTMFLNHFGVSPQHLVVRNVYRPWKNKVYKYADVQEVVLGQNHRGDNMLRLIFHDYGIKEFVAAGLKDNDWLTLIQLLRMHNVAVKDENNFADLVKPEAKRFSRIITLLLLVWLIVSMVAYGGVVSLDVSENVMILLKVLLLVFMILFFLVVCVIAIAWGGEKEENAGQ